MTHVDDTTVRPHALYRFYNTDQLLYVGITLNPAHRWPDHRKHKPWWTDVTRITLETHPSRAAVLEAERAAIIAERPRYNVVHNGHSAASGTNADAERTWTTADMPDECHDHCVPAGHSAIYLPYKWRTDGRAWYQCAAGHRWQCSWGHTQTGDAPELRGVPVEVLT